MKHILLILLGFTLLSCAKNNINKLSEDLNSNAKNTLKKIHDKTVTSICNRSPVVQDAILLYLKKEVYKKTNKTKKLSCDKVTKQELLKINILYGVDYFQEKNITSLKQGDFDGLSNLELLDLDNNKLLTLPEGIFNDLNKLQHLYLSRNILVTLPEGIFNNLKSLKGVGLQGNKLQTLPKNLFNGLAHLEVINLSINNLKTVPDGIFSFKKIPKLKILLLQENKFSFKYRLTIQKRVRRDRDHLIISFWQFDRYTKFKISLDGAGQLQNM